MVKQLKVRFLRFPMKQIIQIEIQQVKISLTAVESIKHIERIKGGLIHKTIRVY
jgi:hypothetical protein